MNCLWCLLLNVCYQYGNQFIWKYFFCYILLLSLQFDISPVNRCWLSGKRKVLFEQNLINLQENKNDGMSETEFIFLSTCLLQFCFIVCSSPSSNFSSASVTCSIKEESITDFCHWGYWMTAIYFDPRVGLCFVQKLYYYGSIKLNFLWVFFSTFSVCKYDKTKHSTAEWIHL